MQAARMWLIKACWFHFRTLKGQLGPLCDADSSYRGENKENTQQYVLFYMVKISPVNVNVKSRVLIALQGLQTHDMLRPG